MKCIICLLISEHINAGGEILTTEEVEKDEAGDAEYVCGVDHLCGLLVPSHSHPYN